MRPPELTDVLQTRCLAARPPGGRQQVPATVGDVLVCPTLMPGPLRTPTTLGALDLHPTQPIVRRAFDVRHTRERRTHRTTLEPSRIGCVGGRVVAWFCRAHQFTFGGAKSSIDPGWFRARFRSFEKHWHGGPPTMNSIRGKFLAARTIGPRLAEVFLRVSFFSIRVGHVG